VIKKPSRYLANLRGQNDPHPIHPTYTQRMENEMKKETRKQKEKINPQGPKGNSKYARKLAARKQLARRLGMPPMTPFPVLWSDEEIES